MSASRRKIIFDTDPGIDDAMALLYLNACDSLELVGITTILGNATLENCTNNALFLCEQFGIDSPVYRGANQGIDGSVPDEYPDFVHGSNGLADVAVTIKKRTVEKSDACDFMLEATLEQPGEITIIAVGRLTNIALAIQQDPSFAGNVREIIFMGGAAHCEGNVTPWAEANIIGDPEAAEIVFKSGIPLTMVGLDVTLATRMSSTFLDELTHDLPGLRTLILEINAVYAKYYKDSQDWDDFPVHDSSAIAFAHHPDLFTVQTGELTCVLEGAQRGRTVFTASDSAGHRVCVNVDSTGLLDGFLHTVTSAYS